MTAADQPKPRVVKIPMSVLMQIWMDGFASGAATSAKQLGATDEQADAFSNTACASLSADPGGTALVRKEVNERLRGIDGGPQNFVTGLPRN